MGPEVGHGKRRTVHGREFKLEAVKLVQGARRGGGAGCARSRCQHENVLRKWMKAFAADPQHAFPGKGQHEAGAGGDRAAAGEKCTSSRWSATS